MFKNLTIRQISIYITVAIWLVQLFMFLVLYGLGMLPFGKLVAGIYLLLTLGTTYLVVRFLFEFYIFRKIKLIYKVISGTKESMIDARDKKAVNTTLEDVNAKVLEWAEKTGQEILALKSLENYRKKFLGDISHELKTPIFSIQGYLHTLIEGGIYDENINMKYLDRAVINVARLQTIVDDLEMINNLESDSAVLEFSKFDIKDLVLEVFNDLEFLAKEKGITLELKPGANQGFLVYADITKIEQVLINLINNSIKYGIENGLTKVSFYDMHEVVLIEVSDNGMGIGDEDIKHVFDRFYRAEKSRSREVGGSGLGLSIVKHIMEAHKQKISVRSTLGKGSTFGFTLKKA